MTSKPLPNASASNSPNNLDPDIMALVQRIRASTDPNIQRIVPLSENAKERIAARVLDSVTNVKEKGRIVAFPSPAERASRTRRVLWAGATALALAAGSFGLYSTMRGPDAPRVAYALEISGDAVVRGNDHVSEGPVHLRPSTRLRVRLTPNAQVRDKALRVLVVRSGKAYLVTPAYTLAPDGAIVIDAEARDALGDQIDGPAELVFIVGSSLPNDDEITRFAENLKTQSESGFHLLRRSVIFEGWGNR